MYIEMIILPRQARDRHRESTQKKGRVSAGYANASPAPLPTNAAGVLQRIESSPWPEVQPDVVSYTSVIDAYAKAANYDAVCTLAKPSSRFIQALQVLPLSALPLPLRGAWLGASLDCSLSRMQTTDCSRSHVLPGAGWAPLSCMCCRRSKPSQRCPQQAWSPASSRSARCLTPLRTPPPPRQRARRSSRRRGAFSTSCRGSSGTGSSTAR